MDDAHRLVLRLFNRAVHSVGSVAHLAVQLGISRGDIDLYVRGEAMPPEAVLLKAVELVLADLPHMRSEFPAEVWQSLSLPK
jgi:hypothetical protein